MGVAPQPMLQIDSQMLTGNPLPHRGTDRMDHKMQLHDRQCVTVHRMNTLMRTTGRLLTAGLLAFICLFSTDASAQTYMTQQPQAGPWNAPGPGFSPVSYGPPMMSQTGGYPPMGTYSGSAACPDCQPGMSSSPIWGGQQSGPGTYTGTSNAYPEEYGNGPIERFLATTHRGAFYRLEYLLWTADEPGDTLLGSPINGIDNPGAPFLVADPADNTLFGTARVFDIKPMSFRDLSGIRGTYGLSTKPVDLELNIFKLQKEIDTLNVTENELPSNPIPGFGTFIATSTFVNGALSNNVQLYDQSFQASFETDLWGAEAKMLFNTAISGYGIRIRPLTGFQYLNLEERLLQVGVFNNRGTIPDVTTVIDSRTHNHLYGGVIGGRAEWVTQWFTLGIEPKFMLGLNSYQARLTTQDVTGPDDPFLSREINDTKFSPVFQGQVYARIHVSENFTISVGYDVLWAARVTRAHKNIFYNIDDTGATPVSDFDLRVDREGMVWEGLSIGAEYRFPKR